MTRSVLITGCSTGIGYDAAHTLSKRGWRVFATCRTQEDCAGLRAEGLESFRLDYDDEASITAALGEALTRTGGTLHALYNNGAFALPGAVEDIPRAALRAIFETNLFGYHDLIRQVIPVMRAQGHGRIVNCSSILGLIAVRERGAYIATKFALEGLTDTLRIEMRGTGIHVSLLEPGPITSQVQANAIENFEKWIDLEKSRHADKYRKSMLKRLGNDRAERFQKPPSAVTRKLIHALEARRPRTRYYVTMPTHVIGVLRRVLPSRALDWVVSQA